MSGRVYHWKVTGWKAAVIWWMFLSPFVVVPFIVGFLAARAL